MKYLPFENITFQTRLSTDEILRQLNEDILPFDSLGWLDYKPDNKEYEGYTINKEFYISRIRTRYNTIPPIIKGELHENKTGTIINVKVRLDKLHRILIIVSLIVFFILVVVDIGTFTFGFVMFMLIYIPTMSSLKRDSKHAKEYLLNLLEAEIKSPS